MIAAAEKLLAAGNAEFGLLLLSAKNAQRGSKAAAANLAAHVFSLMASPPRTASLSLQGRAALTKSAAPGKARAFRVSGTRAFCDSHAPRCPPRRLPDSTAGDGLLGRSTLNIGTIGGGRAPNVVADHAEAEIMFRTVGDPAEIRKAVSVEPRVAPKLAKSAHTGGAVGEIRWIAHDDRRLTTDIPTFDGVWGEPFLIGPGSIHVAHTAEERVSKKELSEAADIYARMASRLFATGRSSA